MLGQNFIPAMLDPQTVGGKAEDELWLQWGNRQIDRLRHRVAGCLLCRLP